MAQRGFIEEEWFNDKLPTEILNETWQHNYHDVFFSSRASLVCQFWQQGAEQMARARFQFYFPDLYTWNMDKDAAALGIALSWCRRLELALLQYCCQFTPQELSDYRAFRAGDLPAIQKILSSENAVDRILLRDNQQRTGFFYFAKNHMHKHRQAIFDGIFTALSAPFVKNNATDNNGEWKEILFDKDLEIDWVKLIENIDRKSFIPELLLFAVVCNQVDEVSKFIDLIKKQNKLNICLPGLLCLALRYDQVDVFLLMLEHDPALIFIMNDFLEDRNISQFFADRLFPHLCKIDLGNDCGRRDLLHWALIFNQPQYFSAIQMSALEQEQALNTPVIVLPFGKNQSLNARVDLRMYQPIKFACLWGAELYHLAVSRGASNKGAHNIFKTAATCGDAKLLKLFLSMPDLHCEEHISEAMRAAIKNGHLNCVRMFLQYQVKINITHIIAALETKQIHILDFFYQNEERRHLVKSTLQDYCKGYTGLDPLKRWFMVECHIPLLKALLQFGLDVNSMGGKNKTPLHLFAADSKENHSVLIKELVAKGAEVDKKDIKKRTPLYCAASVLDNSLNKVALHHLVVLLEVGADPYQVDEKNESVFDMLRGKLTENVFLKVEEMMLSARRPATSLRGLVNRVKINEIN